MFVAEKDNNNTIIKHMRMLLGKANINKRLFTLIRLLPPFSSGLYHRIHHHCRPIQLHSSNVVAGLHPLLTRILLVNENLPDGRLNAPGYEGCGNHNLGGGRAKAKSVSHLR